MAKVTEEGSLGRGLAYFRIGTGRPLLFLPGLAADHRPPSGTGLRFAVREVAPYTRDREVWWVQRREGLATGTDMPEIASDYAEAVRSRFHQPVDVVGSSTGGSVGLQLAADHPDVVRRLVLLSSACRLGEVGRATQRRLADALRRDDARQAAALMMTMLSDRRLVQPVLAAVGWLIGRALAGGQDLLRTVEAEDGFDLTARLPRIATPTLVVGGARDRFYGAEVFRETARRLPHGRLLLYPRKGHVTAQLSRATTRAALAFLDR